MKKIITFSIAAFLLLVLSFGPMFSILREEWIDMKVNTRYEIHHAYQDEFGFEDIIDVQELVIDDKTIKIREEKTDLKASLTPWDEDEGVPPGDIVKIHLLVNEKEISTPNEIWLSNRQRGSRYFSWIDIVTVNDRFSGEKHIKIIQRLTDDDQLDDREWKIITVFPDGKTKEVKLNYDTRNQNTLGVKLINFTNTGLISMGYYSDILQGYPSLVFPFIYPIATSLIGIMLVVIVVRLVRNRKRSS